MLRCAKLMHGNGRDPLDFRVLTPVPHALVKGTIVTERTNAQRRMAQASTETVWSKHVDGSQYG
jgi:hypothetical protein